MIVYKTPSLAAFHHRQQFHATQKAQDESVSDWYKRLQNFVEHCEFQDITDYMLIDKFVSGLGGVDFQKISQVSTWTSEELILVVIGNEHIFNTGVRKQIIEPQSSSCMNIKAESINVADAESCNNSQYESYGGHTYDSIKPDCQLSDDSRTDALCEEKEVVKTGQIGRNNSERAKKHIEKLKETGRYDEYKRKKAESSKMRRLKNKNKEQYLPPELQLLVMNERRRAGRERVKRYRQRKSQNLQHSNDSIQIDQLDTFEHPIIVEQPDQAIVVNALEMLDVEIKPEPRLSKLRPDKTKKVAKQKPVKHQRKKREFECYLCLLKCRRIYELKAHLSIFHPVEQREVLTCPLCPKTTVSREVLSRHLRKCHGSLQTHKCPCCDKDFAKKGQLTQHMLSHPNYKSYICELCGNGFKTIQELNSHMRKHTGEKKFKCGVCDVFLVSRSSYRSHMLTHTGERPFPCKLCDKEFRQTSSLRKHLISIHNQGEKPHLCTTCGKRFSTIYHLRIHSNVHTGARPYQCQYCESTFSQPSALKAHTSRIHESENRLQQLEHAQNIHKDIMMPL